MQFANSIELTAEGEQVIVGGNFLQATDSKNSALALIDVGETMQMVMLLKLPLADSAASTADPGCTIVRRISKRDYFVACNSSFVYFVMLIDDNLLVSFKVPHSHPDRRIIDMAVHANRVFTLAENDNKLGEILLL